MANLTTLCRDPFFDYNLTWNTSNPNVTFCMQDTLLSLIPLIFLLVFGTLYTLIKVKCSSVRIFPLTRRYSLFFSIKMILNCLLIFNGLLELYLRIDRIGWNSMVLSDLLGPICLLLSYLTSIILVWFDNYYFIHTSPPLYIYWLTLSVFGIAKCKMEIEYLLSNFYLDGWIVIQCITFLPICWTQLIIHSWSDFPQNTIEIAPESSASFLSTIFFSWLNKILFKGYKSNLNKSDMPIPPLSINVTKNVEEFIGKWRKRIRHFNISYSSANRLNNKKIQTISIWPVIFITYKSKLFRWFFLMMLHYSITFVNPIMLKLLIGHIDSDEEVWKGILYAVILFLSSMIWTITFHAYCQDATVVSIQMRSSVVSAIYQKALRISNNTRQKFTIGEITNFVSVDAQRIIDSMPFTTHIISSLFCLVMAMFLLYKEVGVAAFAGMAILIILIPVNVIGTKISEDLQDKQMKRKDNRIKLMNEILNGIKVLKLYAWEIPFMKQIMSIRGDEIQLLRSNAKLNALANFTYACSPFLVTLTVFAVYTAIDSNNVLTADKIFVSLALFNIIRIPLILFPFALVETVKLFVSIQRINKFLNSEELDFSSIGNETRNPEMSIEIKDGSFSWIDHSQEENNERQSTLRNISLDVKKGSFIAVVGLVGSGKSSFLSAILGEMDKLAGEINRTGTIAYVPQQAWIQNMTLKNNILFEKPLRPFEYEKVIDACALRPDLQILTSGDATEIGENGINLSGGQKQRVSLARAVYSDADIYLLDDPLSAVDAHVGKHLFEQVFNSQTGILKNKTRIMVTHNVSYLNRFDHILVMRDGIIEEEGSYQQLLDKKGAFAEFLKDHGNVQEKTESFIEDQKEYQEDTRLIDITKSSPISTNSVLSNSRQREFSESCHIGSPGITLHGSGVNFGESISTLAEMVTSPNVSNYQNLENENDNENDEDLVEQNSRLIEDETMMEGKVSMTVYIDYIKVFGIGLFVLMMIFYTANQGFLTSASFVLAKWADANEKNATIANKNTKTYLSLYTTLGLIQGLIEITKELVLYLTAAKASQIIHDRLLKHVLRSPMSFFDTNPMGRVVNRFSADIDTVDQTIPYCMSDFFLCIFEVFGIIIVICYSTPLFLTVIFPLMILYFIVQKFYIATSRQFKRFESVSRSPLFSHFSETVQGVSSIRAYCQESRFVAESNTRQSENIQYIYLSLSSNRWLGMRTETLSNFIILFTSLFSVLSRGSISAGLAGLSITYSLNITDALNWAIRMLCSLETNAVSLERILEYTNNKEEAVWEKDTPHVLESWPSKGRVEFQNYKTRYRDGLDLALKGINIQIDDTEKIGICGRTGAGKSSLTLALFRLIEPADGKIIIDDIDISSLGLHQLRSKLTIIPQDPVLFTGTLRFNLDPTIMRSDEEIWIALEHAHLKNHIKNLPHGLNHEVNEGGQNFSVGQRQLICLARALLRKTKIIILDEATAAIDLETDALIQDTIRKEFSDCTIITIAHRLKTILDSCRVVILKEGLVEEIGNPQQLLEDSNSAFSFLASSAGIH